MFPIAVSELTDNIILSLMELAKLAVEYSIQSLENVSIQYLELKISKSNVLDAYFHADKMKYIALRSQSVSDHSIIFPLFQFGADKRLLPQLYSQRGEFQRYRHVE